MEAIEQIAKFKKPLQDAFLKMIMGRCVELSDTGKANIEGGGQEFFITSINEDETINLVNRNQDIFKGIHLSYIK